MTSRWVRRAPPKPWKVEKPGSFFHPLLATLITGAARLLLMTVERLSLDAGLDWAFGDTDSLAIAKPDGMDHETFVKEYLKVASWFDPLNPYETKGPLFKVEDVNYGVGSTDLSAALLLRDLVETLRAVQSRRQW